MEVPTQQLHQLFFLLQVYESLPGCSMTSIRLFVDGSGRLMAPDDTVIFTWNTLDNAIKKMEELIHA